MTYVEYLDAKTTINATYEKRILGIQSHIARMEKELDRLSESERILARKEIENLRIQLKQEESRCKRSVRDYKKYNNKNKKKWNLQEE